MFNHAQAIGKGLSLVRFLALRILLRLKQEGLGKANFLKLASW